GWMSKEKKSGSGVAAKALPGEAATSGGGGVAAASSLGGAIPFALTDQISNDTAKDGPNNGSSGSGLSDALSAVAVSREPPNPGPSSGSASRALPPPLPNMAGRGEGSSRAESGGGTLPALALAVTDRGDDSPLS